ncbi:MAG: hypothetical protein KC636_25690 [Myxococcales bacterium]|nr:hypothetical protein [Myxococcales bacterium]
MKKRVFLNTVLPALLCTAVIAPGCEDEQAAAKQPDEDEASSEDANIKVELPPPPDFDEGKVADKWEDGSYSIYGLRNELEENVKAGDAGTEITVRGYVQEIYEPTPCPEGETCPPGKQPHIWIVDKPEEKGKKRAMMVVNYSFTISDFEADMWKDVPDVTFEKGQQYTIKGKFKRFSDTGFADHRGLLEFVSVKVADPETGSETWRAPPGAPWHPVTLAAQEEQQKKLIEKVNKDAANRG